MPEVPAVPGLTTSAASLAELVSRAFAPDGALARAVPDFEARRGQAEMAVAVARVLEGGGVLLAEAGTGTGKTLAYLVPAILSRQRVLISTGTKNLQEQIFFKDIPALREALGVPFSATCMKGRGNYLCLHRLDQLVDKDALLSAIPTSEAEPIAGPVLERAGGSGAPRALGQEVFLPMIREWSTHTTSGDRAELEDLPEDLPFWHEVSATAETCLGLECPRYDDCFVTRMRQRAASSDVIIVNHHLLCADAAVRQNAYGEVIPACSHAVLDEAHQLEDTATQYFGYSVSNYRVEELAYDVERLAASGGITDAGSPDGIDRVIDRLRTQARAFFSELAFAHRSGADLRGEQKVRATPASLAHVREAAAHLTGALDMIGAMLGTTATPGATDENATRDDLAPLVDRARQLRDDIRFLLRGGAPVTCGGGEEPVLERGPKPSDAPEARKALAGNGHYVYFVEFRGRGVFLRASPIDVSAIIRELLLDRMRALVFTSATLTVDGSFAYIRQRLGIDDAAELQLDSEFDFERQAILYLPRRMPDPRSPEFAMAAGREVIEVLKRTHGRAFVLFTSYASMRAVQAIAEMALDYPILAQGSLPRSQLLAQFRETPHAVLFATSSFWQGVDVVGEALSCVIIDKLPFASPTEPITASRIDLIRDQGGEPFHEYQVPLAILTLRQGLGRLIRHRRDRGVLAILDPRLHTKAYGRRFIGSLPPAPIIRDLAQIESFFGIRSSSPSR